MKDKKQTMAYGLNMAAVVAGYNEALNWAGERRVTVEELAKTPITDLLDTMARNGIRFTFRAGEIEPEDLPFPLKNGQGDKTTTG